MIKTNKKHPHYSLAMELLCTIPREPLGLDVDLFSTDFGLSGWEDVLPLRAILKDSGVKVETTYGENKKKSLSIRAYAWDNAQVRAQEYWRKVYGQ